MWLADSTWELAADIPHVLDLTNPGLPVQKDIAEVFAECEVDGALRECMAIIEKIRRPCHPGHGTDHLAAAETSPGQAREMLIRSVYASLRFC